MPRPVGFLTWQDAMVASVAVYVPGARDGWGWYVEALSAACDGDAPWEEADEPAGAIGVLVARLHRALATPSTTTPTPVSTADPDLIRGWGRRAEATLDEALASTTGEEGQRLRAVEAAARREVATLASVDRTPIMRIHGDLHVGQILRTPDGELLVSDFDGNPLAPAEERGMPDAAARDVASMARAIDHVGRVVARRRTDRADAIEAWIVRSREAFLAAYRLGLGDRIDLFDERLLRPFEVAQEAHEYVYAARYLPRWRYVPDAAMPALLGLAT
jgi:maltokinase